MNERYSGNGGSGFGGCDVGGGGGCLGSGRGGVGGDSSSIDGNGSRGGGSSGDTDNDATIKVYDLKTTMIYSVFCTFQRDQRG